MAIERKATGRDYTISGPANLEGTTDADGRLLHEGVSNGDYTLTFDLDEDESVEAALVVRAADRDAMQVRFLGAMPTPPMSRSRPFLREPPLRSWVAPMPRIRS
jgi:hypothetical protein